MESKASLRKKLRQARKYLLPERHAALSRAACQRVLESSLWREAKSVLLYAPLGAELDVSGLIEAGWAQSKDVILPKCRENPRDLAFFLVKSWEDTACGAWGIREPVEERCCEIMPEEIALALVPVVGMDLLGVRLGNGGGYYDRVMGKFSCPVLVGFDEQLVEQLPREDHDGQAQWIVTPTRWIKVRT